MHRYTRNSNLSDAHQECREGFGAFESALRTSEYSLPHLVEELEYAEEFGASGDAIANIRFSIATSALNLEKMLPRIAQLVEQAKACAGKEYLANAGKGWTRAPETQRLER
jgi:hypothetical protein